MTPSDFADILSRINSGLDYEAIDAALSRYLAEGDLDARYLKTQYHSGSDFDGDTFDQWKVGELAALSRLGQADSMFQLGLLHVEGDLAVRDKDRAATLIAMAAIMGCKEAERMIRRDFGRLWDHADR